MTVHPPASPELINQIAAGEVIERPSSVVKELVENSLDAGATRIEVDIEAGGARLIRVRDDGGGIDVDELPLAVASHATSKIGSFDDLEHVASMGFRGEALASVVVGVALRADLARARRRTPRCASRSTAASCSAARPAQHPRGTSVEVRDLFYNVPARRKFMRAERTEFAHIDDLLKSLALARGAVEFRLSHNGKPVRMLEGRARRAGRAAARGRSARRRIPRAEPAHRSRRGRPAPVRLGRLADRVARAGRLSSISTSTAGWCAIASSRTRCARRMPTCCSTAAMPAFVLYLELDPAGVDVNVHPAKHEVRFREQRLVHDFLFRTLHEALAQTRAGLGTLPAAESTSAHESRVCAVPHDASRAAALARPVQPEPLEPAACARSRWPTTPPCSARRRRRRRVTPRRCPLTEDGRERRRSASRSRSCKSIFVLAENAHGLVLVDMHAAHERITYEKLKSAQVGSNLRSQMLLVPLTLAVSEKEAAAAEEHAERVGRAGASNCRAAARQTIVVRRIPALLEGADVAQLVPRRVVRPGRSTAARAACRSWRTNCCRRWPAMARCARAGA